MDRLTVLTAHIKYSANGRSEDPVCASGVAGDLGDAFVGKWDVYASVAGADRILDILQFQTGSFKSPCHRLIGAFGAVGAGAHVRVSIQLAVNKDDCLRAG